MACQVADVDLRPLQMMSFMKKECYKGLRDRLGPLPVNSCAGAKNTIAKKGAGVIPDRPIWKQKPADIRIFGPRAIQVLEEARGIGFSGVGIQTEWSKRKTLYTSRYSSKNCALVILKA